MLREPFKASTRAADGWTVLNWLTRYAPALAALEEGGPLGSVLDVGCGQHGLACVRPDYPFVGLDIEYHGPVTETMVGFRSAPGPLPFEDAAFDTVLCLDALEHVPRPERAGFVAELARVAAGRVLLACPSAASQRLDDYLRRAFAAGGSPAPSWLTEHFEHRLPEEREIAAFAGGVPGFAASPVPMANGLLCTMVVLADMNPAFARDALAEYEHERAAWTRLLAAARFGPSLRAGWLLERTTAATASVRVDDLERTAIAALRPDADVRRADGAPVARPAALETDASRRLWLSPEWERPETWLGALDAYLAAAGPDDDACLCLDATAPEAPPALVAALAGTACERLAGDTPYADVLVVGAPAVTAGVRPVAGATEVRAALGLSGGAEADARLDALAVELRGVAAAWRAGDLAAA